MGKHYILGSPHTLQALAINLNVEATVHIFCWGAETGDGCLTFDLTPEQADEFADALKKRAEYIRRQDE